VLVMQYISTRAQAGIERYGAQSICGAEHGGPMTWCPPGLLDCLESLSRTSRADPLAPPSNTCLSGFEISVSAIPDFGRRPR